MTPNRAVGLWLLGCTLLVAAMVTLGGVTRLTQSGLSIVEWQPISGALPPIDAAAWQAEFDKYQQTPEYVLVNRGMTLSGFRSIFLMEYAHRLLARVLGLAFVVPLVVFAVRGQLGSRRLRVLLGCFALGGLQAVLGWYMVKSGLVDEPRVSHYRLAGHLLLALSLFALLFWNALGELRTRPAVRAPLAAHRLALALAVVIILTATWGAFMAGLHAGHVAPSFPTMNGRLIPDGLWSGSSVLASFLEDAMTVHFVHRTLAYSVAVLTLSLAWYVHRAKLALETRRAALLLVGMVAIQITLGALTVLFYVPIALAAIHQTVAVVLLGIVLFLLSRTTQPRRSASVSASDAQPSALRA